MVRFIYALLAINFFYSDLKAQCTLTAPSSVSFTNIGNCQVTVNWSSVENAAYYTLQYKISSTSSWTTIPDVGLVTSYTIAGLATSTGYKVKVAGVCSNDVTGAFKLESVKTTSCSTPIQVTAGDVTQNSALMFWTALCGPSSFKIKYKLHGTSQWTTISNIPAPGYNLSNLQASTSYDVQVLSVCGIVKSKASPVITFTTIAPGPVLKGKNVLFILLDDARQDPFAPDGGPSFFSNPNISRIAYEGVRFKHCFPSAPQCAPSRSSIYTGLYPHKTGVLNNSTMDESLLTTLAEILQDHNYYTGLVGKYHVPNSQRTGYDYWMENSVADYLDQKFDLNGFKKVIPGHKTDVVTDSAIGFLHKVPSGKSFYLEVGYAAPHIPYHPRVQDAQLYINDTMPLPDNNVYRTENYSSFLYPCHSGKDDESMAIRGYYRMLAGVEYSVGRLLNELTSMNLIDSTLIIFSSDNGYLLGEHHLDAKRLAYEESIHLPLYMRYPPLIATGQVIEDEIAMNIDLAPTILDYVGIENPVAMDGISLRQVIDGTQHRSEMFCEFFAETCTPDIRSVRSLDYKYIQYGCDSVSEEFFDLVNDPKENLNLIFNSAFDSLINVYRDKLSYWENYYNYTTPGVVLQCSTVNPVYERSSASENTENAAPLLEVYPNPASSFLHVRLANLNSTSAGTLVFKNILGEKVIEEKISVEHGQAALDLSTENLNNGMYLITWQAGAIMISKQVVIAGK